MREGKFRLWWEGTKRMEYLSLYDVDGPMIDPKIPRMDYTGLKDKNGKEIYEGDIIKWSDFVDQVIFDSGCFCLARLMMRYEATYWLTEEMEVIGNPYENPELLENGILA